MRYFLFLLSLLYFACTDTSTSSSPQTISFIPTPNSIAEQFPFLFAEHDTLWMTWIQEKDASSHLQLAYFESQKQAWSIPQTIQTGKDWFVNWADFPSVIKKENRLMTSFLPKNGAGTYAYNVAVLQSTDYGNLWQDPFIPHTDNTPTEHGFVSLFPFENTIGVVWLDGRNAAQEEVVAHNHDHGNEADMTLRFASIDENGEITNETLLDERVCSCCQTDAVTLGNGQSIVVYRDRSKEEIRDFSYVYYANGKWSSPKLIHQDNWTIAGCPVNGAAIDANGNKVAIAWYTMADGVPKVNLAFSDAISKGFSNPIQINTNPTIGRVDVKFINTDQVAVTNLEEIEGETYLILRIINTNGSIQTVKKITPYNESRASGFPRIAVLGNELFIAGTVVQKDQLPQLGLWNYPLQ